MRILFWKFLRRLQGLIFQISKLSTIEKPLYDCNEIDDMARIITD